MSPVCLYEKDMNFTFFPWTCNSKLIEVSLVLHLSQSIATSYLNPHQAHDGPRYNFPGLCHHPGVGGNHGHPMAPNTSAGRWGESVNPRSKPLTHSVRWRNFPTSSPKPTNDDSELVIFSVQVCRHDWFLMCFCLCHCEVFLLDVPVTVVGYWERAKVAPKELPRVAICGLQ